MPVAPAAAPVSESPLVRAAEETVSVYERLGRATTVPEFVEGERALVCAAARLRVVLHPDAPPMALPRLAGDPR